MKGGAPGGAEKGGAKGGGTVPEYWFRLNISNYEAVQAIFEVKFTFFRIVTWSFQIHTPALLCPPFSEILFMKNMMIAHSNVIFETKKLNFYIKSQKN